MSRNWRSADAVLADQIEQDNAEVSYRDEGEMAKVRRRAELEMAQRVIRTKRIQTGYVVDRGDREKRDGHILELWWMGYDYAEIGELVDLTPQRVGQIIRRFDG